jgi:hypothetical protein
MEQYGMRHFNNLPSDATRRYAGDSNLSAGFNPYGHKYRAGDWYRLQQQRHRNLLPLDMLGPLRDRQSGHADGAAISRPDISGMERRRM